MLTYVIKSDGTKQDVDADKLNKMAQWANEVGLCWSSLVLAAVRKVEDGCTTKQLQTALIDACAEQHTPEHLAMAARLYLGTLYKEAYGSFEAKQVLSDFYHTMVSEGAWEAMDYTEEELTEIDSFVDHTKDLGYRFSTIKQLSAKYAVRIKDRIVETPQYTFVGIAMKVSEGLPKNRRMHDIRMLYKYLSELKINAPTPFQAGLRTLFKGYASCAVFTCFDDADSINTAVNIGYDMTCASAGLGGELVTRSAGDSVRNGKIKHYGKLPYYRYLEAAVKSTKQTTRGGGATVQFSFLDPEYDTLIRLKHPTSVSDKQIRGLDYAVGGSRFFAEKANRGEEWMLLSLKDAPEVYAAMYNDDDTFQKVYEEYESSDKPRTYVNAFNMLYQFLVMRQDVGRVYHTWLDEMNTHTPFKDAIRTSNLCLEIFLPTKGYEHITDLYKDELDDSLGEVALCFLAGIPAGRVTEEEYEDVAYYTLLMVDRVIDIMEYPYPHMKRTVQARRSVGIGITNLAHFMAMNKLSYMTEEGRNAVHAHAEMHSYFLHKASVRLAREFGACEWLDKTKYPDGWTPLSTYNRNVDELHSQELRYDWEALIADIIKYGMRNSVLEATPPYESSSGASDTTNSLYPIRELYVTKRAGTSKVVFEAPDAHIKEIRDAYEFAWDIPTEYMIYIYAIVQKFHGQGISADSYKDYSKYPDEKIPASELIRDYYLATKYGMKSWYYQNGKGGVSEEDKNAGVSSVANDVMVIVEDEDSDCEACKA